MKLVRILQLGLLIIALPTSLVWAGGSGFNVLVVVNQSSTNSVELGNYYREQRQVPPQNFLRMNWTGGNITWTTADFTNYLLNPLMNALSTRSLTNQVDYVLLSMDIPYQVTQGGDATTSGVNSTTAALFYGFKSDYAMPSYYPPGCNLPDASSNSYAGSEAVFRESPPLTALTNPLMAMMLTSSNLAQAEAVVDHGLAGDMTFPSQEVVLSQSSDIFRNVRYTSFDNAMFDTRLRGDYLMIRTNSDSPYGSTNLLGYETGVQLFSILPNTFVPGAMADSLTSYGGLIFLVTDHTTLLSFLNAGASGSYGTVVEPCAYLEKFPSPQTYFYQARGFSLAECYYQSITNPYQGLLAGEPLSAPFARPGNGQWLALPANATLRGTTNLSLQFKAADALHPINQVDLFVDGLWNQTLTNIQPSASNVLSLTIAGQPFNYRVPGGATLTRIAADLSSIINASAANPPGLHATAHGDRIELHSLDLHTPGSAVALSVSNSAGTAPNLTTFLTASGGTLLDSVAYGVQLDYTLTNAPQVGDFLSLTVIKTNGEVVSVSLTNTTSTTNLGPFATAFFNTVNSTPALLSGDGAQIGNVILHEDYAQYGVYPYDDHSCEFNVQARGAGWAASQLQVFFAGSGNLTFQPTGTNRLDENVYDLQPRAHLYVTTGITNLSLVFSLDTTKLSDGFHQLSAVAYEGSHVRTQARISQSVHIQNTPLVGTLQTLVGGSNTAIEATLQFLVGANTTNVSRIDLFTTGGWFASATNQPSPVFAVPASQLGIGLHPVYALITTSSGAQYQTESQSIRIVGPETPFPVQITTPPPTLCWPASAGRSYDILSATGLLTPFQFNASVAPSNSVGIWVETNISSSQRFYRITTSQ